MNIAELLALAILSSIVPIPDDSLCSCGHAFIRHEGDTGGHCFDCQCQEFAECANVRELHT